MTEQEKFYQIERYKEEILQCKSVLVLNDYISIKSKDNEVVVPEETKVLKENSRVRINELLELIKELEETPVDLEQEEE